jgi:hypothetical protein
MIGQPDYLEKVVSYWIEPFILSSKVGGFLSLITLQLLELLIQSSGLKVGTMGFPSNS